MKLGHYRVFNALLFLAAASILVIAGYLEPHADGIGTHQQLGLAPCVFEGAWGLPCPACGWTTSFALMASGQVVSALINQPFGAALSVLTFGVAILSSAETIKPRARWIMLHGCFKGRETKVLSTLFTFMFASWAYKIALKIIFLSPPA